MITSMTHDQRGVLRERLRETIVEVTRAAASLEEAIAEPDRVPRDGEGGGFSWRSRPPWNAAAGYLVTELHAGARELEGTLRRVLSLTERPRGSSAANTVHALNALSSLAESCPDRRVFEVEAWLSGWLARALVALGQRDLPRRLPRQPGEAEPRCPYCERLTLRFWSSRGEVRCVNPACATEDGDRPRARMEYSPVARDWVLAWGDGAVGIPA